MFIQYKRTIKESEKFVNLGLNGDGFAVSGQFIVAGSPTVITGIFMPGALIQNIVDGTVYINEGSIVTPVWGVIEAGTLPLPDGEIFVGDASGNGQAVPMSGDAEIDNTGAVTVTDLTISGEATGDILYFNGTNWIVIPIGTAGQVLTVNVGATGPEWA